MNRRKFTEMSAAEFAAYKPKSEEDSLAYEKEADFRVLCAENDMDPTDSNVREHEEEIERENNGFWDDMDDDEREGWTDNMNRD